MPDYNTPEFLSAAIKAGMLNPNAGNMDAYSLHGFLSRDDFFRKRRLKVGLALPFDKVLNTLSGQDCKASVSASRGRNQRAGIHAERNIRS